MSVKPLSFGRTETERLAVAGLMNERCTLMHAGWLTAQDIRAFARAGMTINYNPVGNAMLGSGVTAAGAVQRLLAAQVPVVLGSDYAPLTVTSPFELMRAALMLQRDLMARDDGLTLEQALRMAASEGNTLGRPGNLGRVDAGQLADLILIKTSGLHHLGIDHPVPALALHARADDVANVIVELLIRRVGRLVDQGCGEWPDLPVLHGLLRRCRCRAERVFSGSCFPGGDRAPVTLVVCLLLKLSPRPCTGKRTGTSRSAWKSMSPARVIRSTRRWPTSRRPWGCTWTRWMTRPGMSPARPW